MHFYSVNNLKNTKMYEELEYIQIQLHLYSLVLDEEADYDDYKER